MQPTLQKQKSVVPSSCHQVESCVVDMSCHKFWQQIRALKFHELCPAAVTNTEWVEGGQEGMVGSTATIHYKDGAKWTVLVTEVSDKHHSLCYDVIYTDHELPAHGVQVTFDCSPVTFTNQTFVRWTTDFSNDADAQIIQDQKYKKLDVFKAMTAHLANKM